MVVVVVVVIVVVGCVGAHGLSCGAGGQSGPSGGARRSLSDSQHLELSRDAMLVGWLVQFVLASR